MIVSSMKSCIVLLALICCQGFKAEQSLVETEYPGVCTKELQGTLEERVKQADVVLTGTIRRLETESHGSGKNVKIDGDPKHVNAADERSSTRTVAIVELWQVVKGSLAEVANQSSASQDQSGEMEHSMMQNPFLKLYGLWNTQLCGSSLSNGDTRIFFLRKFRDVREINFDVVAKSFESEPTDSSVKPVILRTKNTDGEANDTELGELKEPKPHKKGKKKKNKKEKKKRGGKKKKGKKTKKSSRPRKPKASKGKRKKRKSESMRGRLIRLSKRHKRSSMVPNKIEKTFKKRDLASDKPRSVLVLNASPARITLTNLNMVDELAKLS